MLRIWLLVAIPVLSAQTVPGRYIVEFKDRPAMGRAAVRAQQARLRPQIETAGARVLGTLETIANAMVVEIPDRRAARLASISGVARVHPVRLARPFLDHALALHRVPLPADAGLAANGGAGVKIAIIDSGIAQDHPAFQDASLASPPGFPRANQPRDLAYTNSKVIVARNYVPMATPQDSFGHGTAVAMEAAGTANTGPLGTIAGVAPKAWLGSYKVYQNENPFGEDTVLQAIEDAVNDGMDVINLSLGVALAPRAADDVLVAAVERAAEMGVVVCVAAGNLGNLPNTIASPATAPSVIAVGASSNDRLFAPAAVRLTGGRAYYALPGYGRGTLSAVTAPLADTAGLDGTGEACTPFAANSLAGRIALLARSPQTGPGCSFAFKLSNAQNAGAAGAIVYMSADSPDLVTMNVGASTLPAVTVDYTAGAALRQYAEQSLTIQLTTSPLAQNPALMAPFSSRGPTADGAIKPDLVATGMFLYTATQRTNASSFLYGATGYIREADGTSFATPLIAGAAALLKSARPPLTAAQVRSLLVNSAAPMQFSVQWSGAGVLDVSAALAGTIAVAPVSLSFGSGAGAAEMDQELTLTNLGAAEDTFTIAGPAASSSVSIAPGASRKIVVHFSAPGLPAGEYQGYVHIHGSQSAVDTVVPYWYGVPDRVPKYVAELQAPDVAASGTQQDIYFRVTDQTGLPLPEAAPVVKAVGGSGAVLAVTSEDVHSPGVFHAAVMLGDDDGANVFEITAGRATRRVTIVGQR